MRDETILVADGSGLRTVANAGQGGYNPAPRAPAQSAASIGPRGTEHREASEACRGELSGLGDGVENRGFCATRKALTEIHRSHTGAEAAEIAARPAHIRGSRRWSMTGNLGRKSPEPSAVRSALSCLLSQNAPGTFAGEFLRSAISYKSFVITHTTNQIRQMAPLPTGMKQAEYIALFGAGSLVMGAVSEQLRKLAKGNEPRPIDNPRFWAAAALQGAAAWAFSVTC